MLEPNLWHVGLAGIIVGIFLSLWLKERPIFECVECNWKIKYNQYYCDNCGQKFNWNWYKKRPWIFTRYQTDEQFRKWTILVPVIKPQKESEK